MASAKAPADIIPRGGRESTQMAAATTNSPSKPPAAVSQPNWNGDSPTWSEAIPIQKAMEPPAARSPAAITSRKPSLKSVCRFENNTGAIVTLAYWRARRRRQTFRGKRLGMLRPPKLGQLKARVLCWPACGPGDREQRRLRPAPSKPPEYAWGGECAQQANCSEPGVLPGLFESMSHSPSGECDIYAGQLERTFSLNSDN